MTIEAILREIPLFAELAEADLARIAGQARVEDLAPGTRLIEEGTAPDAMYAVLDGELTVTKQGPSGPVTLNTCGPGDLIGELSVLDDRPRTASVTAPRAARVVVLPVSALHDLLRGSLAATLAILRTIASRLANTEAVLRQQDTLASLGRIAAGLAHEFNNPAAAVKRGAGELEQRLDAWERAAFELRAVELDEPRRALLHRFAAPRPAVHESALQRARRERALEEALAARGIASPWELAPTFAALHWDAAALDELLAAFPGDTAAVLRWIESSAATRAVTRDVASAAARISELVDAVRVHSRLGEAPIQDVDIHESLEATLALLRHQLGAVTIRRDYAPGLPLVEARGGALNQVWTNVIDNALYALAGAGELAIITRPDGDHVIVEITDTGPGIPAELQGDVWKPFFTTKPVGEGSGLGLHVAYNVIVHEHRGRIELESRPGRTCFRVSLPVRGAR